MASSASASSLNLSQDELKAVELTRQRLFQLSNSIGSLKNDVALSNPLPPLDSLQRSADILQQNMRSVLETVSGKSDLFQRVAVHPSTNFPGRTHENILHQLLRKKPDPDFAASMQEGRETFTKMANAGGEGTPESNDLGAMLSASWEIADKEIKPKMMAEYAIEADDPYTADEREMGVENVRTGLRRALEESESEYEEEGEGGEYKVGGGEDLVMIDRPPPPLPMEGTETALAKAEEMEGMPLDNMLRLATRGELIHS